ncbi:glucosaminidase domain-containing protein [Escherichia coli]|uniref:glucosaminidase domain-containing protein n=1 Tax=Escherichia coli TaxID=562 RepID=UPI003A4D2586
MQKNAAHTYAISSLLVLSLTGCAWIPSTPLVQGATSAQPVPGPTPVANGSYNLFGVKASGNWKGPVTEITTTEYENGEAKKVKAKFRVYSSYLEALSDYVGLLTRNPRYAAVTTAASAEQGAQALQDAGYATDPHYARKLTNMIQQMKSISDKVSKTYSMNIDNLF